MAGHSVTVKIDGDTRDFEKTLKNLGDKTKAGLADIKAGIDLTSAAAKGLFNIAAEGVKYTAGIEQLQTSFEVMTGSAEKAAEVVSRLRTMGAETPFETADLAATTQLLMQYGFTADDALDKMRMLGDVAQGNKEALSSIALGYAQMSSAQKVNLQDLKQMIAAGFNPLQEISERTGESMNSLYDRISKGKMSVDEITTSLRAATSEGGKFFGSMEKQSQTLNGQLSTLKDNASQLLGSLTEGLSEELRTELLPLANNMIAELEEAFDQRGIEGLIDAATGMLPDLLNMMTGRMEDSIASLSRFAPQAVTAIMRSVPGAIRSASSVLPQVTAALFDVAGLVVQELTTMLPEMLPAVLNGFYNLFNEGLKGVAKLVTGFYAGVEQAIHKGQTKVMGLWVDNAEIAKYDFTLDVEIDGGGAYAKIEEAYSSIRTALSTDLLTDEQRIEITGMIGEDYQAIYDKLLSFGLTESEAKPIADSVSNANEILVSEFNKLNVGVPGETILKWFAEAKGSKIALTAAMKSAGLDENEISKVTAVYDGMLGKVTDGTPSVMQAIYDKLSDGKPDDTQTVETLKGQITTYISGLLTSLDEAYKNKLAELDVTAADYDARKAALDEWYKASKDTINGMDSGMRTLVDTLAGAPTKVVQARVDEFIAMEQQLFGIEQRIDALNGKAKTAAEEAFRVVRSGAKADETTISTAIKYKYTEFEIDTQSAEDTYAAAIEELNAQFASGDIKTTEEYDALASAKLSELETAKAAARAAYEQALREIFAGIAESEGATDAIESAAAKMDFMAALEDLVSALRNQEGLLGDALGADFTAILAEYMQIDPALLENMPIDTVQAQIENWAAEVYEEIETAFNAAENPKLQATYQAALQDGMFSGTYFDTENSAAQLANIIGSTYAAAAESAAPEAEAAGSTLLDSAVSGAGDSEGKGFDLGDDYGSGYALGIASNATAAYNAAYAVAKAAARGTADGQDSASPSKVAMSLGRDFGEGYEIGLQKSIERARAVAVNAIGGIATAAALPRVGGLSALDIQQAVTIAREESPTILNINGKEFARATASDTNTVQNSFRRSIALGVGK